MAPDELDGRHNTGDVMATVTPFKPKGSHADRTRLREIITERSFRRGDFTLSSGAKSDHYFDMKATLSHPEGVTLAAEAFLDEAQRLSVDVVGGLELGAVPALAPMALLSWQRGKPMPTIMIRKKPKDYGSKLRIEGLAPGETLQGKRVLIVDDVATKGGSIFEAVQAVRDAGAIVGEAVVLLDRLQGATAFLAERGVTLVSIFRKSEFLGE